MRGLQVLTLGANGGSTTAEDGTELVGITGTIPRELAELPGLVELDLQVRSRPRAVPLSSGAFTSSAAWQGPHRCPLVLVWPHMPPVAGHPDGMSAWALRRWARPPPAMGLTALQPKAAPPAPPRPYYPQGKLDDRHHPP